MRRSHMSEIMRTINATSSLRAAVLQYSQRCKQPVQQPAGSGVAVLQRVMAWPGTWHCTVSQQGRAPCGASQCHGPLFPADGLRMMCARGASAQAAQRPIPRNGRSPLRRGCPLLNPRPTPRNERATHAMMVSRCNAAFAMSFSKAHTPSVLRGIPRYYSTRFQISSQPKMKTEAQHHALLRRRRARPAL